jgi:molybdopterin-guanine dinucleotide biosynthesis protein A
MPSGPRLADPPAAIVLAGGTARRMGGTDKLALRLGGATILDRVLVAAGAVGEPVVVVGPARPSAVAGIVFAQEADPGGGPVPAVAAGLEVVGERDVVLVLAGDLPLLTAEALGTLLDRLERDRSAEASAAADEEGRPNPLLAAYRGRALRQAVRRLGEYAGMPASCLLPDAVAVVDLGQVATLNVNSPRDVEEAARLAGQP